MDIAYYISKNMLDILTIIILFNIHNNTEIDIIITKF